MASSVEWRSRLCSAFERLNAKKNDSNGCKNILQVKDGVLYVWIESDDSLVSLKLSDSCENEAAFQCFVPSTPPVYEIESLVCNPSGQRLALVGRSGMNVVEFPRHQRPANSSSSSSPIRLLASSTEIAERFFLCNPNCHVLQVQWHPGSDTSTHLVALFSNNYLRVYDCCAPSTPVQLYQLGQVPVFRLSPSSSNSFGCVLGDTVVDFDFGRPVRAADHLDNRALSWCVLDPEDLVWPLFLLRGNGDIYAMWGTNPKHSDLKSEIRGPLTMHPPAEDNYGVDACSIVCLPSVPPVLAIATCSGMIYHCIVLDSDVDQCPTLDVSWRSSTHVRTLSPPDVSLYVYESVELELVLAPSALDDHERDTGYPIRLYRDPTTTFRYHCSHATGVHTVALPLIPQLEFYANQLGETTATEALSSIEYQDSIIEHLICTKPLPNSPTAPIIGLAVAYGHALGGATLLCLTSPFDLLALPLVPTYFDSLPPLLLDDEKQKGTTAHSTRVSKEPFDQYVRRLLQRQSSNPLLKSHSSVDPTPQECVHILSKATSVLREEYIKKQDLAKEEIQKRLKGLNSLKSVQFDELKVLNATRNALTERAETLAERYEDLQEKQEAIVKRVERVIRALLRNSPVVSDAEQNMRKELSSVEQKMKNLKTSIEQMKAKQKYQSGAIERQLKNVKQREETNRQTLASEMQLSQIKQLLATESRALATLSSKMGDVQRNLGI